MNTMKTDTIELKDLLMKVFEWVEVKDLLDETKIKVFDLTKERIKQ